VLTLAPSALTVVVVLVITRSFQAGRDVAGQLKRVDAGVMRLEVGPEEFAE
jgi:hypothetical protein